MTLEMLNYLIELALNNTSSSPDMKKTLMVINSQQMMNCQLLLHRFHNKKRVVIRCQK
jgi:thioredoxin-related protein